MGSSAPVNREAVLIHLDGARDALRSAQYSLDGGFFGSAINRAYYAFFYAATALLLTLDLTRSRHSGVMSAFREHFVKPGYFSAQDSRTYGDAFELKNVIDYEMVGKADEAQAHNLVENARRFVTDCEAFLSQKGYL